MKWNLKNRWFALLGVFVFVATVAAGSYNQYSKTANDAVGDMALCYNAIDSTILDGTIVSVDTTTAATSSLDRIVVRPYAGTALTRPKCIGVAVGNIPASSSGGLGKILLTGYHPRAKVAVSNLAANTMVKVGLVHGSFATAVDSLGLQVGWAISMNSGISNGRYTAKIIILRRVGDGVAAL